MKNMLDGALAYLTPNGYRPELKILPCVPGGKDPACTHGVYDATTDVNQVRRWWTMNPNYNIGVPMGANGLICIDIDSNHDAGKYGDEQLLELENRFGPLPDSWEQKTAHGGRHLIFQRPKDIQYIPSSVGLLAQNIDIRCDAGYIICEPSVLDDGGRYFWEASSVPSEIPLAELPQPWISAIMESSAAKAVREPFSPPEKIERGLRNDTLFRWGCSLRAKGATLEEICVVLRVSNQQRCAEPLSEKEVEKIAASACRYAPGKFPAGSPSTTPDGESLRPADFSDAGNAEIFTRTYGSNLVFCDALGWLSWDGQVWKSNDHEALRLAEELSKNMLAEARESDLRARQEVAKLENAVKAGDEPAEANAEKIKKNAELEGAFLKHARDSRRAIRIQAIPKLAKPHLVKPLEIFDNNASILNTPGGIVDLLTGEIRPHEKSEFCTKMTRLSPGEKGSDRWNEFVSFCCCGDLELVGYLQMRVGAAAFGKVFSEGLDFIVGDGCNGKSTFFNAIFSVFGSYAASFDVDILTDARSADFRHEAAGLRGKRFVLAGELAENRRLSTAALKRLTSTDVIHAELKYKDSFDFIPSHSTFIFTNHLPKISTMDAGTWRRIRVLPFQNLIDKKKQNPRFLDELLSSSGESIVRWIVDGAVKFASNNYKAEIPAAVRLATEKYRQGENTILRFISDACELDPEARTGARELYTVYHSWTGARKEIPMAENIFSKHLTDEGFQQVRPKNRKTWVGIKLR